MFTTIKDPGIAKGFGILAQAMGGGDANSLIQADLARVRRDNMVADQNVKVQELSDMQADAAAREELAAILSGNPNFSDPSARGNFMGAVSRTKDGLQYGPKFATGAATFVNPNFVQGDDMANVLMGSGVVTDYGNTQSGMIRDNQDQFAREQYKSDQDFAQKTAAAAAKAEWDQNKFTAEQDRKYAWEREKAAGAQAAAQAAAQEKRAFDLWKFQQEQASPDKAKPFKVDPELAAELQKYTGDRLQREYSDVPVEDMTPMIGEITREYSRTNNIESAIANVMGRYKHTPGRDNWGPWNTPGTLTAMPTAPAQPAMGGNAGGVREGQTATNPNTGQKIIMRNGTWEPL